MQCLILNFASADCHKWLPSKNIILFCFGFDLNQLQRTKPIFRNGYGLDCTFMPYIIRAISISDIPYLKYRTQWGFVNVWSSWFGWNLLKLACIFIDRRWAPMEAWIIWIIGHLSSCFFAATSVCNGTVTVFQTIRQEFCPPFGSQTLRKLINWLVSMKNPKSHYFCFGRSKPIRVHVKMHHEMHQSAIVSVRCVLGSSPAAAKLENEKTPRTRLFSHFSAVNFAASI